MNHKNRWNCLGPEGSQPQAGRNFNSVIYYGGVAGDKRVRLPYAVLPPIKPATENFELDDDVDVNAAPDEG